MSVYCCVVLEFCYEILSLHIVNYTINAVALETLLKT